MMPGVKELLDVVMVNLQRYVAPQISTDDGRMTLLLITYVLGFLYVEEHDRPALHARALRRDRAAAAPASGAVAQPDAGSQSPTGGAAGIGEARIAVDHALREQDSADATSRALQLALRAGADTDPEWTRRFARAELDYVEHLADAVNDWAYGAAVQAIPDTGQRQLTAELVTEYLKKSQADHPSIRAASVVEIGRWVLQEDL